MLDGRARVNLREQHVSRNLDVGEAVPVRYLDVLHFGGLGFALEGLHAHQLDLDRLNLQLRVSLKNLAVEGLSEAAVHGGNGSLELELRDGGSGARLQVVVGDRKILGNQGATVLGVDTRALHCHVELLLGHSLFA